MMLKEFVAETNFSQNSMTMHVAAIRSFYMFNMEGLAKKCVDVSQIKTKPYKCPTPFELRKMEEGRSLREILCIRLTSCGFREDSEARITWGHIWDELFDEDGNLIWDGKSPIHVGLMQYELKGKTSRDYSGLEQHAFLYPNVVNILLKYKEWLETVLIPRLAKRVRYDKQFVKAENLEKFRITRDTPILLSLYSNSNGELYGVKAQEIYRMIVKASKGKYSPQDLRRYAETQLEESNTMTDRWRKKILGHKISGEENPYSRPKIKALREKFVEAIPFIDYTVDSDSVMEKRKLRVRCEELQEALAQKSQALAIAMTVAQDLKFLSQFVLRLQAHGIPPAIVTILSLFSSGLLRYFGAIQKRGLYKYLSLELLMFGLIFFLRQTIDKYCLYQFILTKGYIYLLISNVMTIAIAFVLGIIEKRVVEFYINMGQIEFYPPIVHIPFILVGIASLLQNIQRLLLPPTVMNYIIRNPILHFTSLLISVIPLLLIAFRYGKQYRKKRSLYLAKRKLSTT